MIFGQMKMETVPLLSPNMDTNLLKKSFDNICDITPNNFRPIDEDNATLPVWKEDFQDLSNWCMAMFQGQCDFPVGESIMDSKISGMRYEGSDVSTAEEGFTRGLNHVLETGTFKETIAQVPTTCAKHDGQEYNTSGHTSSNENKNTSDIPSNSWLCPPISDMSQEVKKEVPNQTYTSNVSWPEMYNGLEPDVPLYTDIVSNNVDSQDSDKMLFVNVPTDTCDVFPILEPNGIDNFDLLSYVCDEMPSSVSNVSTESGKTVSASSVSTSAILEPAQKASTNIDLPETNPAIDNQKQEAQPRYPTRSGGMYTKTIKEEAPDTPESPPRKSSWTKRSYTTSKRSKRKRYLDSDSEDVDDDDDDGYRESRVKNNEASRKSRMNKKAKELEMGNKASELEKDNRILKMKVEELEKLVTSMRNALLKSALNRGVNKSKRN